MFKLLRTLSPRILSGASRPVKLRIAVLISGHGSNLHAILKQLHTNTTIPIEIAVVISDRADAKGLELARRFNVPAKHIPSGPFRTKLEGHCEIQYIERLRHYNVDLICLAGFMRVVKTQLLKAFAGRIVNIHPSLLPAFPGLNVHARVIAAGVSHTGCTVHVVTAGIDSGHILAQRKLRVRPQDTPQTLAQRVLKLEHKLYAKVIHKICRARHPLFTLPLSG